MKGEHPEIPQKPDQNHVQVAVITTSGSYPGEGFEKVPSHQKIRNFLERSARELKIISTSGWVAKVAGSEIKVDQTYLEQGLSGEIEIDFGPQAGGGGAANE